MKKSNVLLGALVSLVSQSQAWATDVNVSQGSQLPLTGTAPAPVTYQVASVYPPVNLAPIPSAGTEIVGIPQAHNPNSFSILSNYTTMMGSYCETDSCVFPLIAEYNKKTLHFGMKNYAVRTLDQIPEDVRIAFGLPNSAGGTRSYLVIFGPNHLVIKSRNVLYSMDMTDLNKARKSLERAALTLQAALRDGNTRLILDDLTATSWKDFDFTQVIVQTDGLSLDGGTLAAAPIQIQPISTTPKIPVK